MESLDIVTTSLLQSQYRKTTAGPKENTGFQKGSPMFKLDLESNGSQHTFKDNIQQWF